MTTAILILIIVAAASFAAFVYPYLLYPMMLAMLPKRAVQARPVDCSVSLLFCAYNEARSLPEKLKNLRELKAARPSLEILAYDDNSNDGTSELLAAASDILTCVPGAGRTGKAHGMKILAAKARGDILVFTDANVILATDAIDKLLPYYGDPQVGGVCGTLKYLTDERSVTSEIGSAYWRLDEKLRTLESATGNVMGADGSIFSVRRSLYPDFPDTVLDDLTVSMSVIFAGKRLIKASDVVAYEGSVAERSEELRRKIRIGARASHTHGYLRSQLRGMRLVDRFKYNSRKVVRWYGAAFLAIGTVSAAAAALMISPLAGLVLIAAGAGLFALCLKSRTGALSKIGEILLATGATLLGVFQGSRGRTMATWSPAKSR
ncbi:cellulose synthase/poly-beta-1,6-N-acetylglucosamine synthase-like glycosyltransferase [Sphingomonas sp. F9_3S_D5_B_2]